MTARIPLPLSTLHSLLGLTGMMVEDVTVFVDVEEYNRLLDMEKEKVK